VSEHLSAQIIDQYCRRVMSSDELLAADDHLAACAECRQRIGASLQMDAVVSDFHHRLRSGVSVPESDHPSYEQIVALVDGEIDGGERQALENHLEICAFCADEVGDLRSFRAEVTGSSRKKPALEARRSFLEKIGTLLHVNVLSAQPALTAALALLLITASIGLFFAWRAMRRSGSTQQSAGQTQETHPESNPGSRPSANVASSASPESKSSEQIVLALNDGSGRVTVDDKGNVNGLAQLPPSSSRAVKRALTIGKLEAPEMSELIGTKGRLLGTTDDGTAFSLLSPVATITRGARPTLRWQLLNDASSYTVAVLDVEYNPVATSPPLTTASWTPPRPLDRGRVYVWQVTALKDGKEYISPSAPAPEARFKVLDKAKADELSNVERLVGDSHLVRGTLYARAGLLADAEQEMLALVAANPNSPVARQLLQSVRSLRRRSKQK
jgi:Putative zinc-finger